MPGFWKNKIRLIAGALVAVILCQEIGWAAPGMSSPVPGVALQPPVPLSTLITNPAQLEIPFEAVTLQEVHVGTNGKLIIHIQDAHSNLSGQQSLAKAVEHFLVKYGIQVVLVEGADRDVTLDPIRKLAPLAEWKIIARRFLYEGIISGEEFLNLTSEQPMRLRGIEYKDLYDDAVRAYAALVDRRKDILHYLYQAKVSLDRLKVKMYPDELKRYEEKKGSDSEEGWGGADYKTRVESLVGLAQQAKIDLAEFPQTSKLKELFEREKSLSFEKANQEQSDLLRLISQNGNPEAASKFTEAAKRLHASPVSQYRLIRQLLADGMSLRGREAPVAISQSTDSQSSAYPALTTYAAYLERFLDVKIDVVLAETELLEDRIFETLLPTDDAKKVRAIDRFLGLLGNAYKLQMSSHDFKMFEFNEKDFATKSWLGFMNRKLADLGFFESMIPDKSYLEDARADFGKFYQLVSQRDEAFTQNAKKIMTEENTDAAVLIAGGYHTDHLTELLRAEGTSYIVLTPLVTDKTDQKKYEEILLSQLKTQEKYITTASAGTSARSDTGTYRAENVASTRIPRGVRAIAAMNKLMFGLG